MTLPQAIFGLTLKMKMIAKEPSLSLVELESNLPPHCVLVLAKVTHPTGHGFQHTCWWHPHLVVKRFKANQRRMFYTFPRLPEAMRFVQLLLLEMGRSTRGRLADSFLLFSHSRRASLENEAIFPAKALGNY